MRERVDESRARREELRARADRRALGLACVSVARAASGVGLCARELERVTRTPPLGSLSRGGEAGSRGGRGTEMQRLHEALDELEAALDRLRALYWGLPSGMRGE